MSLRGTRFQIAVLFCVLRLSAPLHAGDRQPKKDAPNPPVVQSINAETARSDGEQRFRANCGRCHASPRKFSPRVMSTVVRHMRVRATITDEDMRLILVYMTQ